MTVPTDMTRNRPKYESDRKAPKIGVKDEMESQTNKMLVAPATLKLYVKR